MIFIYVYIYIYILYFIYVYKNHLCHPRKINSYRELAKINLIIFSSDVSVKIVQ